MKKVSQAVIYGKFFDFPCSKTFLAAYRPSPRTYVITIDRVYVPRSQKPFIDLLLSMMRFDIVDKIRNEDLQDCEYFTILTDVLDSCAFEHMIRQITYGRPYVHIWHPYATFDIVKGKAGTYENA